jgi:hypothetical protein
MCFHIIPRRSQLVQLFTGGTRATGTVLMLGFARFLRQQNLKIEEFGKRWILRIRSEELLRTHGTVLK